MSFFGWFGAPTQAATVDSVTSGIEAVQKQVDEVQKQIGELRSAVASLKNVPETAQSEVVAVAQAGGARRLKKGSRTMKNKRTRRVK